MEDTELIDGLVFTEKAAGNVKKIEKAKIGLIQFQVSPPKTDMDNQVCGNILLYLNSICQFWMDRRLSSLIMLQWIESYAKNVHTFWKL